MSKQGGAVLWRFYSQFLAKLNFSINRKCWEVELMLISKISLKASWGNGWLRKEGKGEIYCQAQVKANGTVRTEQISKTKNWLSHFGFDLNLDLDLDSYLQLGLVSRRYNPKFDKNVYAIFSFKILDFNVRNAADVE